jgi:TonB-dependent starch-binding outer membrane protein SusC
MELLTSALLSKIMKYNYTPGLAYNRLIFKMLRIMKLTSIFLFAFLFQTAANSNAQLITLAVNDAPLQTVLKSIEKQSGYTYFAKKDLFKNTNRVTLQLKDVSLQDALNICFKNQPLRYFIDDKVILIEPSLTGGLNPGFQAHHFNGTPPITGIVRNPDGQPISGANVIVKGTKRGTVTNVDGSFSIEANNNDVVIISSIGFSDRQLAVNNNTIGIVTLVLSESKLDEVQVIAYGTTTKRLSTGNVGTVKAEDIQKQPVMNPLQALQGRVAGLSITQVTGVPGGRIDVRIRGQNSLRSGKDPFYVIDGVPYTSTPIGGLNPQLSSASPLNYINPSDIESIDILKDADATSIYGSRAANGAILITTKKGKAGPMLVSMNINSGITKSKFGIKLLNAEQYLMMRDEAFKNDGVEPGPSDYDVNGTWDRKRNTDWVKELTQGPSHYTSGDISISGGNNNTQYLLGAGYSKQQSGIPRLIKGDGMDQRGSVHFAINSASANKRFTFAAKGSLSTDKNTAQSVDVIFNSILLAPNAPNIFNADGTLNWAPINPGESGTWANPFADFFRKSRAQTTNLVSNIILTYELFNGLDIKTNLGYNSIHEDDIFTFPASMYDPAYHITTGSSRFGNSNSRSWIIEPQLNYHVNFGSGKLTALAGGTFNKKTNSVQQLAAENFPSDVLLENIQAGGTVTPFTSDNSEYNYAAVFGKLTYNWQDKYILNTTVRRDGSSRFGPGNQFANFYSVSGAWIFTKEKFLANQSGFLSFGKLRASYGTTGNDQIPDYSFLDLYSSTTYPYQGLTGLFPASQYNPDLAWEETRKIEGALEMGFLKDRITLEASYYHNRSGNQLLPGKLSIVTGYIVYTYNKPAVVQNAGMEFTLNTLNIKTRDFHWTSSFNISANRNKLVSYPNLATSYDALSYTVGQPVNVIKVFPFGGVNQETGLYQFRDTSGNMTTTPTQIDRTVIINTDPRYTGGFQNSFVYKGFEIDVLFQFVKQVGRNIYSELGFSPGLMSNQPDFILDRWQKPGDIAKFQKFGGLSVYDGYFNLQQSEFIYSDASYIRLKNLSVSWQTPAKFNQSLRLKSASVYVQSQNLLTITKYIGPDPESQGARLAPPKILTFGIRASF